MATDPEGQHYDVNDPVWYDDGHSADWQHGTVAEFSPGHVSIVKDGGPNIPVSIVSTLVHVGKPTNPPDH